MSAVDQAYRYAINLPCDWIIVTSMRETRLYHKGLQQHKGERKLLKPTPPPERSQREASWHLGSQQRIFGPYAA
jgi:hypothetical protein